MASRWLKRQTARPVIVSATEFSVSGLLAEAADDGLLIRAAEVTRPGEPPVQVAGEVFVPRSQVLLVQVLGEGRV